MRALKSNNKKIKDNEPFKGLFTQGMVSHITYRNKRGEWVEPKDVEKIKGAFRDKCGLIVETGKV